MTRREFITLIVGIVTACPAFLRAQQHAEQIWRIGYLGLSPASSAADRLASLRVGLADLGFVEGKNNRTKTMMRQAYGYRNRYNLRMRILLGADT